MPTLAVLLRPYDRAPASPERWPIARAARELGVPVVFGGEVRDGLLVGHRVERDGWSPCQVVPDVAVDRFPSQTEPDAYAALLHGLPAMQVFNPPPLNALLRDKVRTQYALHDLGMPLLRERPDRFTEALPGFCKPRFGSFGRGVFHTTVVPPAWSDEPHLMQAAVPPPRGYAGVALRILVQRTPEGPCVRTPVARYHRTEAVVNHARDALVAPCDDLFPRATRAATDLALAVLERFPDAAELGVDAVLDPNHVPHLIEVNSRPRGRLAALAEQHPQRFGEEHHQAILAPLRYALFRLG